MAIDISKLKSFKAPEVRLHIASWGHDNLVTHNYGDEDDTQDIKPLVFQYGEQKVMGSIDGPETRYAYHISSNGVKHGVEYLTRADGTKAKLWSVCSTLRLFTDSFSERFGAEKPRCFKGEMSNEHNVAYARYSNSLTISVHIARPDSDIGANHGSIWFVVNVGDTFAQTFEFAQKKAFIKECRALLGV